MGAVSPGAHLSIYLSIYLASDMFPRLDLGSWIPPDYQPGNPAAVSAAQAAAAAFFHAPPHRNISHPGKCVCVRVRIVIIICGHQDPPCTAGRPAVTPAFHSHCSSGGGSVLLMRTLCACAAGQTFHTAASHSHTRVHSLTRFTIRST